MNSPKHARLRLEEHLSNLENHFKKASDFLVKCQIAEPYICEGTLKGSVCPWEIGVADTHGLTILEDFHDTLEAIWVWTYYTKISNRNSYKRNIDMGWKYVTTNFERFIPFNRNTEGLYDCSQVLLAGSLYQTVFRDKRYYKWIKIAGERLVNYLLKVESPKGREYSDPWWMTHCLASAAALLDNDEWLEIAKKFVEKNILERKKRFYKIDREPKHRGPGGHDFFSENANKALALLSTFSQEKAVKDVILNEFLPSLPGYFVKRHTDENVWNANLAAAIGKCYLFTGEERFLHHYFIIMDELRSRDYQNSSALPRSENFPAKESWVTFFYAYAYASIVSD